VECCKLVLHASALSIFQIKYLCLNVNSSGVGSILLYECVILLLADV